jgi:hypothetical protein
LVFHYDDAGGKERKNLGSESKTGKDQSWLGGGGLFLPEPPVVRSEWESRNIWIIEGYYILTFRSFQEG